MIREALVAADEPDAVVERIAAAEIVTLTITEGGYERGGMLELLARGIAKRSAPLTVISCDNVPRNGEVLRDLLGAPPGVAFPCTVVDRIVPAPEDPLTVIAEPFSLVGDRGLRRAAARRGTRSSSRTRGRTRR